MYKSILRLDMEMANKIKEQAKLERRSVNNMICYAIERYVDNNTDIETMLKAIGIYDNEVSTLKDILEAKGNECAKNLEELITFYVIDGLLKDCKKYNIKER